MPVEISLTSRARTVSPHLLEEVERRIRQLRPYFPEMKTKITIGLTRSYDGMAFQTDEGHVRLMLDIRKARNGDYKAPTYWTLAHELMHLDQFNNEMVPSGERACDLHTLARLPPRFIDDSPSYLVISRSIRDRWDEDHAKLAHKLAIEALTRRRRGLRNYICWWEERFENAVEWHRKGT